MRKNIFIVSFLLGALVATATAQDGNKSVVLKGQVVCSLCWFEADRKTTAYGTEADLKCAAACSEKGIPTALAVTGEHDTTLYLLEDGAFKKPDKGWLAYVGKYVEVTGVVHEKEGKRYVKVDALTLIPSPKAAL